MKDYIETYVLGGLCGLYLLMTASLFISGCHSYLPERQNNPRRSVPIRERSNEPLPVKELELRIEPKSIEQIPAPIEKPKNKPILPKPTPKEEVEDYSESALAMNRTLEFRL